MENKAFNVLGKVFSNVTDAQTYAIWAVRSGARNVPIVYQTANVPSTVIARIDGRKGRVVMALPGLPADDLCALVVPEYPAPF